MKDWRVGGTDHEAFPFTPRILTHFWNTAAQAGWNGNHKFGLWKCAAQCACTQCPARVRMNINGSIFFCPFVPCHLIVPHRNALVSCYHLYHRAILGCFSFCCKCCQVCVHQLRLHCQQNHVLLLSTKSTSCDRVSGFLSFSYKQWLDTTPAPTPKNGRAHGLLPPANPCLTLV